MVPLESGLETGCPSVHGSEKLCLQCLGLSQQIQLQLAVAPEDHEVSTTWSPLNMSASSFGVQQAPLVPVFSAHSEFTAELKVLVQSRPKHLQQRKDRISKIATGEKTDRCCTFDRVNHSMAAWSPRMSVSHTQEGLGCLR